MNVLIVEDESPKLDELKVFFETFPRCRITCARSVRSAIDFIRKKTVVDVIVLDMSLPTFDILPGESGGVPKPFGGREIMRYLARVESSCPIIVLTGYPSFEGDTGTVSLCDLEATMRAEFGTNLVAVIQYSVTNDEWARMLNNVLLSIKEKNDNHSNC